MTTTTDQPAADTAEAAFTAALSRFQANMPHIGKEQTANTGTYSYSYADLADIGHATLSLLAAEGFAWSAKTMVSDAGFLLLSSLKHSAGWTETSEWPLPDPLKASAQQVGSAMTYGRRYTFTALTGVTPGGEDDDAQAANSRPAADAPDPLIVAKKAVMTQAKRLDMDVDALRDRYAQDNDGQVLEEATADDLFTYAKKLAKLGKNGLPLNKDGTVSKRQTTEDERVDAGLMSEEQAKAHKALVKEQTENEQKAVRTHGIEEDDPWASIPVATPGGAA